MAAVALSCHAESPVQVVVRPAGDAFVIDAVTNLKSRQVVRREGNTLLVAQPGSAHYGPLWYSFQSEREVRLEPMTRIVSREVAGSARRMESQSLLVAAPEATSVRPPYATKSRNSSGKCSRRSSVARTGPKETAR